MPAISTDNFNSNFTSTSSLGPFNLQFSSFNHPPNINDLLRSNQNNKNSIDLFNNNINNITNNNDNDLDYINNFLNNYDDNDDDSDYSLLGSKIIFDGSENGFWNGKFIPPPPRPPYMDDIITDGVTTCDLCSWAMPNKNKFIFEGTIEKASELGWPFTLIIVSIISAILGAIVMITIVRCKKKKTSNRNGKCHNHPHQQSQTNSRPPIYYNPETHVQWWSRNKRTNNHLRRSNIYTSHPAGDSIRGLQTNSTTPTTSQTMETCNWPNVTTIVVTS